ncbi:MAG: hypothetical protein Q4E47_03160 [Candidatus Saccharibacteria bacterium]|nr:hypothetical protein [Candidatus Saccharibacteria bacterium]
METKQNSKFKDFYYKYQNQIILILLVIAGAVIIGFLSFLFTNVIPKERSERELAEMAIDDQQKAYAEKDPILKVTPYSSYSDGFNLYAYVEEDDNITTRAQLITCEKSEVPELKSRVEDYLKKNNLDPNKYTIEYFSSCLDEI